MTDTHLLLEAGLLPEPLLLPVRQPDFLVLHVLQLLYHFAALLGLGFKSDEQLFLMIGVDSCELKGICCLVV